MPGVSLSGAALPSAISRFSHLFPWIVDAYSSFGPLVTLDPAMYPLQLNISFPTAFESAEVILVSVRIETNAASWFSFADP